MAEREDPPPVEKLPPIWADPLGLAALVGLVVVGIVAAVDLIQDGTFEPSLLALFIALIAPLVPALIARQRLK